MSFLPALTLYYPSNVIAVLEYIAIINLDNPFLEDFFEEYIFDEDDFTNPDPLNENFAFVDFDTIYLFGNNPDEVLIWWIAIALYPFIYFMKYLFAHKGPLCK